MINLFAKYAIALIVFLIIDAVWLSVVARSFYAKHLGYLMADKVNFFAAGIFYLLFVVGVLVFVVNPALSGNWSWLKIIGTGALFGLITYATYDLTNQATIKDWPVIVTVVDLLWGASLSASVSAITIYLIKLFNL